MSLTSVVAITAAVLAFLIWRGICVIERASKALERVGDVLAYSLEFDED